MLIIRGMLALAQVAFIPGFLAIRLGRQRTGSLLETTTLSFALSLVINYVVVSWVVLAGIDYLSSVMVYLAVEALFAAVLVATWLRAPERSQPTLRLPVSPPTNWMVSGSVVVALMTIGGAAVATVRRIASLPVFTAWDAVFSWNHWAYEWYAGIFPTGTMSYPQLVPVNWSLIYRVSGSPELQFLALVLPPLLGLSILVMFYDLGIRRRRAEYLIAIPLCVAALPAIRGGFLFEGLADVPVAFAVFVVFYVLELRTERLIRNWRGLVLPMALACGAAMTKLNGAYAILIVVLLALAGHIESRSELSLKDWGRSAAAVLGSLALICGPWFWQKILEVIQNGALLNAEDLVNSAGQAAGSSGTVAKLLAAVQMFPFGWYSIAAAASVIAVCLFIPRTRWVALAVVIPYTFLWAIYLGVSLRNWVIMLPFAAYLTAFAVGFVLEKAVHLDPILDEGSVRAYRIPPVAAMGAVAAILVVTLAASFVFPDQRLVNGQIFRQQQIGHAPLNAMAYSVLAQEPTMQGTVLTDYWYLAALPRFRDAPYRVARSDKIHVSTPGYSAVTTEMLGDGSIRYLLLSNCVPQPVQALIEERIADGRYSVLSTYRSETPFIPYYEGHPVEVRFIRVNR